MVSSLQQKCKPMRSAPLSPLPLSYAAARRTVFAKSSGRGFAQAAQPLLNAINATQKAIQSATSLESIPPFTDIAIEYGTLLTKSILLAFVKGHESGRKRRFRKNSLTPDDLIQFDWNLQNTAAVAAFSREAFVMAGVQTDELRNQLFEEAKQVFASGGTYRDWADTFSLHGFDPANPYHLRTNYDTAANAAYAAGQWEQIVENKASFPYLRYVTVQDNKVRDEHIPLNGLIFPVDDPFWDTYMPPNDWNCRCSVEQLMESELPEQPQPKLADYPAHINPQFQNNPGKTNQLSLYTSALKANQITWQDAGYKPVSTLPIALPPNLVIVDGHSRDELMKTYLMALDTRIIHDLNHVPVSIDSLKAAKLAKGYSFADLANRVKYINCLEDVLKNPNEVWLQPDNSQRIFYLKRYAKDVVVIAEIEADNVLRYFNIFTSDHVTTKIRSGVPIFPK